MARYEIQDDQGRRLQVDVEGDLTPEIAEQAFSNYDALQIASAGPRGSEARRRAQAGVVAKAEEATLNEGATTDSNRVTDALARFMQAGSEGVGTAVQAIPRVGDLLQQAGEALSKSGVGVGPGGAIPVQPIEPNVPLDALQREQIITQDPLYKAGAGVVSGGREAFPTNPQFNEKFTSTLASGAGQLVPTIAAGMVNPALAVTQYGLSAGQQAAQDARSLGQPEMAQAAFGVNAPIGAATEAVVGVVPGAESLRRLGANRLARALTEGVVREGGQEGLEQVAGNVAAREIGYDPNRPIMEGVPESMAAGAILGGGVAGGAAGVDARNRANRLAALREFRSPEATFLREIENAPVNSPQMALEAQVPVMPRPQAPAGLSQFEGLSTQDILVGVQQRLDLRRRALEDDARRRALNEAAAQSILQPPLIDTGAGTPIDQFIGEQMRQQRRANVEAGLTLPQVQPAEPVQEPVIGQYPPEGFGRGVIPSQEELARREQVRQQAILRGQQRGQEARQAAQQPQEPQPLPSQVFPAPEPVAPVEQDLRAQALAVAAQQQYAQAQAEARRRAQAFQPRPISTTIIDVLANENQVPQTGSLPDVQGQPSVVQAEGQAPQGTPLQEGTNPQVAPVISGSVGQDKSSTLTSEERAALAKAPSDDESDAIFNARERAKKKQSRVKQTIFLSKYLSGAGVNSDGLQSGFHLTNVGSNKDGSFEVRVERHADDGTVRAELVTIRPGENLNDAILKKFGANPQVAPVTFQPGGALQSLGGLTADFGGFKMSVIPSPDDPSIGFVTGLSGSGVATKLPAIRSALASAGFRDIEYRPDNEDGRAAARIRLFESLKSKISSPLRSEPAAAQSIATSGAGVGVSPAPSPAVEESVFGVRPYKGAPTITSAVYNRINQAVDDGLAKNDPIAKQIRDLDADAENGVQKSAGYEQLSEDGKFEAVQRYRNKLYQSALKWVDTGTFTFNQATIAKSVAMDVGKSGKEKLNQRISGEQPIGESETETNLSRATTQVTPQVAPITKTPRVRQDAVAVLRQVQQQLGLSNRDLVQVLTAYQNQTQDDLDDRLAQAYEAAKPTLDRLGAINFSVSALIAEPIGQARAQVAVDQWMEANGNPDILIRVVDDPNLKTPDGRNVAAQIQFSPGGQPIITINGSQIGSEAEVGEKIWHEILHTVWEDADVQEAWGEVVGGLTEADVRAQLARGYSPFEATMEAAIDKASIRAANTQIRPAWQRFLDSIWQALKKTFGFETRPNNFEELMISALRAAAGPWNGNQQSRYNQDVAAMDKAYLEAVARGDMATAQQMVDQAAKAAGFRRVYRASRGGAPYLDPRTNNGIKYQISFSSRKEVADSYSENPETETKSFFINDSDAVEFPSKDGNFSKIAFDKSVNDGVTVVRGVYDIGPYASVERDPMMLYSYSSDIYATKNAAGNVKSADPVTYDDAGNVVLLSQRFNPQTGDIRYSVANNLYVTQPERFRRIAEEGQTEAVVAQGQTASAILPQSTLDEIASLESKQNPTPVEKATLSNLKGVRQIAQTAAVADQIRQANEGWGNYRTLDDLPEAYKSVAAQSIMATHLYLNQRYTALNNRRNRAASQIATLTARLDDLTESRLLARVSEQEADQLLKDLQSLIDLEIKKVGTSSASRTIDELNKASAAVVGLRQKQDAIAAALQAIAKEAPLADFASPEAMKAWIESRQADKTKSPLMTDEIATAIRASLKPGSGLPDRLSLIRGLMADTAAAKAQIKDLKAKVGNPKTALKQIVALKVDANSVLNKVARLDKAIDKQLIQLDGLDAAIAAMDRMQNSPQYQARVRSGFEYGGFKYSGIIRYTDRPNGDQTHVGPSGKEYVVNYTPDYTVEKKNLDQIDAWSKETLNAIQNPDDPNYITDPAKRASYMNALAYTSRYLTDRRWVTESAWDTSTAALLLSDVMMLAEKAGLLKATWGDHLDTRFNAYRLMAGRAGGEMVLRSRAIDVFGAKAKNLIERTKEPLAVARRKAIESHGFNPDDAADIAVWNRKVNSWILSQNQNPGSTPVRVGDSLGEGLTATKEDLAFAEMQHKFSRELGDLYSGNVVDGIVKDPTAPGLTPEEQVFGLDFTRKAMQYGYAIGRQFSEAGMEYTREWMGARAKDLAEYRRRVARGSASNRNAPFIERIQYKDIGMQQEGQVSQSAVNYANELSKEDPELVQRVADSIRSAFDNAAKSSKIPLSPYARSESWILWDIGKQLYMHRNPGMSNKNYRLGNPLTNESVRKDIVNRHLGWESIGGASLPSYELAKLGEGISGNLRVPLIEPAPFPNDEIPMVWDERIKVAEADIEGHVYSHLRESSTDYTSTAPKALRQAYREIAKSIRRGTHYPDLNSIAEELAPLLSTDEMEMGAYEAKEALLKALDKDVVNYNRTTELVTQPSDDPTVSDLPKALAAVRSAKGSLVKARGKMVAPSFFYDYSLDTDAKRAGMVQMGKQALQISEINAGRNMLAAMRAKLAEYDTRIEARAQQVGRNGKKIGTWAATRELERDLRKGYKAGQLMITYKMLRRTANKLETLIKDREDALSRQRVMEEEAFKVAMLNAASGAVASTLLSAPSPIINNLTAVVLDPLRVGLMHGDIAFAMVMSSRQAARAVKYLFQRSADKFLKKLGLVLPKRLRDRLTEMSWDLFGDMLTQRQEREDAGQLDGAEPFSSIWSRYKANPLSFGDTTRAKETAFSRAVSGILSSPVLGKGLLPASFEYLRQRFPGSADRLINYVAAGMETDMSNRLKSKLWLWVDGLEGSTPSEKAASARAQSITADDLNLTEEQLSNYRTTYGPTGSLERLAIDYYVRNPNGAKGDLLTPEQRDAVVFELISLTNKDVDSTRPDITKGGAGIAAVLKSKMFLFMRYALQLLGAQKRVFGLKSNADWKRELGQALAYLFLMAMTLFTGAAVLPVKQAARTVIQQEPLTSPTLAQVVENPDLIGKYLTAAAGGVMPMGASLVGALASGQPLMGPITANVLENNPLIGAANNAINGLMNVYQSGDAVYPAVDWARKTFWFSSPLINSLMPGEAMAREAKRAVRTGAVGMEIRESGGAPGQTKATPMTPIIRDAVAALYEGDDAKFQAAKQRAINFFTDKGLDAKEAENRFNSSISSRDPFRSVLGRSPTDAEYTAILSRATPGQRATLQRARTGFSLRKRRKGGLRIRSSARRRPVRRRVRLRKSSQV